MKNIFLGIAVLLLGQFVWAQSSDNSLPKISLTQKYSAKVLEDYQENANAKIEDLYAYLGMLTDASLTAELKKEVVKSIKNIFENENPQVIDFTSENNDKILLNSLIDKLLRSEPMVFKLTDFWQNNETALSWKVTYTVTRTKSGVSQNFKVNQIVYLFEQNKAFGNSNKNVTVSFLGKME